MEDDKIIALYWARKEEAISETDRKYGSYCRSISFRILNDKEDSEECVNDTWLHTWNAIPPGKPEFLAGFLGKIVRNLSISKYRAGHAQKRGSGETQALLDELEECIPSGKSVEDEIEGRETPQRSIVFWKHWTPKAGKYLSGGISGQSRLRSWQAI